MAESSADIELAISIGVPGTSVTVIRATGSETFASPYEATLTESVLASGGSRETVRDLMSGNTYYFEVNGAWYYASAGALQGELGVSGSLQGENPAEALGLLYQEGAKVTDLGRHKLDGAAMTKYRATVNLNKGFKTLPRGLKVSTQYIDRFKELTGSSKLPVNVWVDSAGVVRQESFSLPPSRSGLKSMGLSGAPKGMSLLMTLKLSNFGVAVTVKPPATAKPLPVASGSSST